MSVATKLKAMFLVLIEEGESSTVSDNEKTLKDAGVYEEYENANTNIDKNNKPQAVDPIAANEEEKSGKVFDVENLRKRLEKRVGGKQPDTIDEKPKSRPRFTVEKSIDEDLQK